MQAFLDTTGTKWPVVVNIGAVARVKRATGVDLTRLDNELIGNLSDPIIFADVLGSLLNLSGALLDDLLSNLDEAAATCAVNAIIDGVLDFFPREKGAVMRRSLNSLREKVIQAEAAAVKQVDELVSSPRWSEILDQATSLN